MIWSVVPPGGNGTITRIGRVVQPWAAARGTSAARMPKATARAASARRKCFVMGVSRSEVRASFGRTPAIDLDGAGLEPRNELAAELGRVVERVESADQERVDAERVVFEHRIGDLLGGADQA